MNEHILILIIILQSYAPTGPINNIPVLGRRQAIILTNVA